MMGTNNVAHRFCHINEIDPVRSKVIRAVIRNGVIHTQVKPWVTSNEKAISGQIETITFPKGRIGIAAAIQNILS